MNSTLSAKYLSFSNSSEFRELCQSILNSQNIYAIAYFRAYHNGDYFHLCTCPDLNHFAFVECGGKYIFDHRLLDIQFAQLKNNENKIYLLTEGISKDEYWAPLYKKFNIKGGFNIIERSEDYYDGCWFTSTPEKTPYNFFVNQVDILNNFMLYLRESGDDLIKTGKKNKIKWINNHPEYLKMLDEMTKHSNQDHDDINLLKPTLKLKRYPLKYNNKEIYITPRELDSLKCLAQGYTYKEIGRILGITDRTAQSHIMNIKLKTGIISNEILLKTYHKNNLADLL